MKCDSCIHHETCRSWMFDYKPKPCPRYHGTCGDCEYHSEKFKCDKLIAPVDMVYCNFWEARR